MKRTVSAAILVSCLLVARAAGAEAAPAAGTSLFWLSAEVGYGFAPLVSEMGHGGLGAAWESRSRILAIRYAATEKATGIGLTEIGVLYGFSFRRPVTSTSVAAGIGYVTGVDTYKEFRTVGVPLEAQFTWMPLMFVGLTLGAYGNLNLKLPVGSLSLGLKLGRLR